MGAGLSAAVGAPTWNRLLNEISSAFFDHFDYVQLKRHIPAEKISIAFTSSSGASRKFARTLTDQNPLLAAQLMQNCVKQKDWNYLIRKLIYDNEGRSEPIATRHVARLARLTPHLTGIINFNYDDLFERHLPAFDIDYTVLTHERPTPKRNKIPIYHPHGWLPQRGGQDSMLMLSEEDYHERSQIPYSWSNVIQIAAYCSSTAVFVGNSMTDPSLRGILRSTASTRTTPHYAFLPTRKGAAKEDSVVESLFDNDLVAMKVRPIRYPTEKKDRHSNLWSLISILSDSIEDESALTRESEKSRTRRSTRTASVAGAPSATG